MCALSLLGVWKRFFKYNKSWKNTKEECTCSGVLTGQWRGCEKRILIFRKVKKHAEIGHLLYSCYGKKCDFDKSHIRYYITSIQHRCYFCMFPNFSIDYNLFSQPLHCSSLCVSALLWNLWISFLTSQSVIKAPK